MPLLTCTADIAVVTRLYADRLPVLEAARTALQLRAGIQQQSSCSALREQEQSPSDII
jgi:hypothetical protein